MQLEALTRRLAETGVELRPEVSPAVSLMLTNALGRIIMMEKATGMTEAQAFVEQFLQRYESAVAEPEGARRANSDQW